ncbi:hypothetical protein, conserved [Leishmania tarentolae]|uniref:Kinesin motor domain-containing protein n=1 Tax=Leishmania tarentolae TaxID=5689 RepID=A0A640KPL7_LEITA|nr:hypothetical protein, conserved [Leishmania tarentolae]
MVLESLCFSFAMSATSLARFRMYFCLHLLFPWLPPISLHPPIYIYIYIYIYMYTYVYRDIYTRRREGRMSTRTYCVIPHEARQDTAFFQGVFEDGVRVLYRGRLQSFVFFHVLSPAHDYIKHINGPLLATLREGGNATLVLATPNSEDVALPPTSMTSGVNSTASKAQADAQMPSSRASPSPALSQRPNAGLAEATAIAVELYAHLFPLLFRNLEACSTARLSVVTVSASERVLLDNLREDRRIRTLKEAHKATLTRSTSATEWGTVLQVLENRHIALEESPTSLEGQTACVVTVELQGYGRLVVVDAASAQELLQQLTLVLNMQADGDARTYPPHTPLRDLLEKNVAPQATVQVVCVPATPYTVRQTMRVLHFSSTVEAMQNSGVAAASAPATDSSASTASYSRRLRRPAASLPSTPSKLFSTPAAPPIPMTVQVNPTHSSDADFSPRRVAARCAVRPGVEATYRSGSNSTSDSFQEQTPARLPVPSVQLDRERQRAREQHLLKRLAVLEEQLRSSEEQCDRAQASRDRALQERNDFERELRGKTSLWTDLQRTHQAVKKENAEYAQLVERLGRRVRTLEQEASRQKRQDAAVVKQLRKAETEKEELTTQLTQLRREVMLFRKDATRRARKATLSHILPSETSAPATGSAAQQQLSQALRPGRAAHPSVSFTSTSDVGRHAPRARRINASVTNMECSIDNEKGDDPYLAEEQEDRVAAITVDELRWRNRQLLQEVDRLQERLLSVLTATAKRETAERPATELRADCSHSGVCPMCDAMQERLGHLQAELAHACEEKDALLHRMTKPPAAALQPRSTEPNAAVSEERNCSSTPHSHVRSSEMRCGGREGDVDAVGIRSDFQLAKVSPMGCTQHVAASLLTGCASLDAQLTCAQMTLSRRLRGGTSASAAANNELFDPISQLSPLILQEHKEAVTALAEALRHIAEKPASRPTATDSTALSVSSRDISAVTRSLLPPVPRCATAADADMLANHLSFEVERCQHLRAFMPTFAQLAVATEHLTMRLESTHSKSN